MNASTAELGTFLKLMNHSDVAPSGLKDRVLSRVLNEPCRVETDVWGGVVSVNPAFTALCGYSFDEIVGRKPGSFLQGAESDPVTVEILRSAVAQAESCDVEMINYHKNGSPYRVRIVTEPLRDISGTLTGFRAVEFQLPLD